MKVYPFGYAAPGASEVLRELMASPRALLIDTRYMPHSTHVEWRRKSLEQRYGQRYRWAGQFLGNRNYKGGEIELVDPATGICGLRKYLDEGYDLVLLCACQDYAQCHRHVIIDLLLEQMPTVEIVHQAAAQRTILALSIRQPYAYMLANPEVLAAYGIPPKCVENREWTTRYRGQLLIHASTRFDDDAVAFWVDQFPTLAECVPENACEHDKGGIVGIADLVDVITESDDPWFLGTYGFVLANARPLPFTPYPGSLKLFSVPASVVESIEVM